jgi:hypothetical protein
MFSGRIERVDYTHIFARRLAPGRQLLVYEMKLDSQQDVAMILPLPVPPGSGDGAVRFHSLKDAPHLFVALGALFPLPVQARSRSRSSNAPAAPLEVHKVGAFEASFVPSLADFDRLDPRFRIPEGTIDKVPAYRDWGFAVFRLAATAGLAAVHPMAFDFPTREPSKLFFPTVHVHDGHLPEHARFSHLLYAQDVVENMDWYAFEQPLGRALRGSRREKPVYAQIFDLSAGVSRRPLHGLLPNTDTWAELRA